MAFHGSFSMGVIYGKATDKGMGKYKSYGKGPGRRQRQGVVFQYCAISDAAATAETLVSWNDVRLYHRILHGPTCDPKHMCYLFHGRKTVIMYL